MAKATKRLNIGNSTLDVGSEKKKNRKAWSISANTDIFNIKEDNIDSINIYTNKSKFIDDNPLFGQTKNLSNINLKKINAISDYCNKSGMYTSNYNSKFQENYQSNPCIFRRPKGMCSEFASHGVKHSFISSPFGRR